MDPLERTKRERRSPRAGERRGGSARDVVIGAIARDRYESGRPSEEEACRTGDERFLALRAARTARGGGDGGEPR